MSNSLADMVIDRSDLQETKYKYLLSAQIEAGTKSILEISDNENDEEIRNEYGQILKNERASNSL